VHVLLVEPNFPTLGKSKNHHSFLPIGLLKIASYLRSQGHSVLLTRGESQYLHRIIQFQPHTVWVTSLFTYWAEHVKASVEFYKNLFPRAKIVVGGIYASLMPEHCKSYTGCDKVYVGVLTAAERYFPAYHLAEELNAQPIDYQIIHASRGCIRKCPFCHIWKLEPKYTVKKSIKNEVKFKKLIFYDNNFLANPYIEDILNELIQLKKERKIRYCECQSGFDGRILLQKPYLANLLKQAGFKYPRIAWDWGYEDYKQIEYQIETLLEADYSNREIFIFMLYNWEIPFEEMEAKRRKAWEWKIQVVDCRFRPLTQTYDYYNPRCSQTEKEYYIHPNWTDKQVKTFRRHIRRQNICVRHNIEFYSRMFERSVFDKETMNRLCSLPKVQIKQEVKDAWFPED